MRVRLAALLTILGLAASVSGARAQEPPLGIAHRPLAEVLDALPTALPDLSTPASSNERLPRRAADGKLGAVAAVLYGSMIVDTKSTFDSSAWCPRCVEANPFAAPFVKAGPAATYTAGAAFDTGIVYLSMKMRRSSNPAVRRVWFVVPIGLAAGHFVAARHNYGLREICVRSPGCR